ncbi:MAG TPA: tRNA (N(6)-L-threonylcarbamoyladenosine(37)-C(2))-methylthiotransferase MtaB [Nitrospirales bacterium]|nr:tRNA (N(6)-L-threonylcarbamoyladenosine(37)-C(2))-methylthiotransferase MtaB [Nitrospirales bacterium]
MRASLHTLGCRLNQSETATLADRLRRDGYQLVPFGQPTDLLVLNTCSVTEHAESDCRYAIRHTLRHSPNAFVAVTGCYAQTGVEELRSLDGLDLIVGTQHKMQLPDLLPRPLRKRPAADVLHTRTIDRETFTVPGAGEYDTTRASLKVQDGCDFMCAFCLIPFARGHERSRDVDDILREARALAARGHRELVLTGVNIGRYREGGRTLLDVIDRLETIAGLDRIRVSSIEPTTIPDALLDRMVGSSKLCRHLHVPLQSGDDGILSSMKRRYTVAEYAAFVERAAARVPDIAIGTDVMVGFPGETEAAFERTVRLSNDLPFSYLHVFSYSERPGTAANRLPDTVPSSIIAARSRTVSDISRAKRLAFYRRFEAARSMCCSRHRASAGGRPVSRTTSSAPGSEPITR